MTTACSCRSRALRAFVNSVARVHASYDHVAKSSWQGVARQTVTYSATQPRISPARLPCGSRTVHTASDSNASASALAPESTDQSTPASVSDPLALQASNPSAETLGSPSEDLRQDTKLDESEVVTRERYKQKTWPKKQASKAAQKAQVSRRPTKHSMRASSDHDSLAEFSDDLTFSFEEQQRQAEVHKGKQRIEAKRASEEAKKEKEQKEAAREEERRKNKPLWALQKEALKKKFPEGWAPRKRLSPDALNGIRALHKQFPDMFTTAVLAQKFEVSPEAIRRILRANWDPTTEEEEDRQRRWANRGAAIWGRYAELGMKPPKKWRDAGIALRPWGGLHSWGDEAQTRSSDARHKNDVQQDNNGETEMEQQRRLKAQHRLAKTLV